MKDVVSNQERTVMVVGSYGDSSSLLSAARTVRTETTGYMEAYSPFPVHGICDVLEFKDEKLSWITLAGGLAGAGAGVLLQVWVSAIAYPLNVGGRPLISTPAFVPVAFETTILFAAFGAALGMFALNGLPRPNHPIKEHTLFERVSQDLFLLSVQVKASETQIITDLLRSAGAETVEVIDEA